MIPSLLRNAFAGFGLAALFEAGLLWFDVAGLGSLMDRHPDAPLAAFLLFVMLGLTFGAAMAAGSVFLAPEPGPARARGRVAPGREEG